MPISKIKTSSITADAASINLNIDANTLFVDVANNRVGINDITPAERLEIASSTDTSIRLVTTAASGKDYNITAGGGGNYSSGVFAIRNVTSATTPFAIFQDNIGIGTTGPARSLVVYGSFPCIQLANSTTGITSNDGFLIFQSGLNSVISNQEAGYLGFETSNTERARIESTGNFLIGITGNTGGGKLDVVSNSGSNAVIQARSVAAGTGDGTTDVTITRAVTSGANWWANARYDAFSHAWGFGASATANTVMKLDGSGNLLLTGGYTPSNTSRLVVRGSSSGSWNNTFSQSNSTVQIIGNEMANDAWNPTLNIAMVRQSLTTGKDSFGGIGFSTIDDSNNAGMYDAGRIAIVNDQPSAVASGTAMAFYTQVGSGVTTNAATERMRITKDGQVIVGATQAPTNTVFSVNEGSNIGGYYIGPAKNTLNMGTGAVILHKLGQSQGFQFSGTISANSWTGQAHIHIMIIAYYTNDAISYHVMNTSTVGGSSPKIVLQLATVSYGGLGNFLAITKNGGGTGNIFLNGMCQNNVGFPYEIAGGQYTVSTTHGTLN